MDYLFFDIESADGNFSRGAMCSFGYVLCDEEYNVIEEDDILINPAIDRWDWYVVKNILPYKKDVYNSMSTFPKHYDRIKKLLTRPNTLILNHGIDNDVFITTSTIKRYKFDPINYHFYDTALFYKKYKGTKNTLGLDKVSEEVCFEEPRDKHPSLEDAQRVYRIMRTIAIQNETTIKELFDKYPYCDGEVINGKATFNRPKPVLDFKRNTCNKENRSFWRGYIRGLKIQENNVSRFNGKKFLIDKIYKGTHFAETMYIAKTMANLGAKMEISAPLADIYVSYEFRDSEGKIIESKMKKNIDEALSRGIKIEVIDINDFLNEIGFKKEDVDTFIDELTKNLINYDVIK